ncbi:hypothetical protein CLV73_1838 [Chryseobacterium geocarposphaerae]|uniref:Uncharacterized protein n=1 Tax=Chryseobacterium geocarposphaerae TaxID=1416776 RepID=A0A2M9CAE5_9FLAO|nr:hypothetical protein CLV73_1838 [Chryseobacterium geocarposphaerae]
MKHNFSIFYKNKELKNITSINHHHDPLHKKICSFPQISSINAKYFS